MTHPDRPALSTTPWAVLALFTVSTPSFADKPVAVCRTFHANTALNTCMAFTAEEGDGGSFDVDNDLVGCTMDTRLFIGLGSHDYELKCVDSLGQTGTCKGTVIVDDDQDPVLFPVGASAECSGPGGTRAWFAVGWSDNCRGFEPPIQVTCNHQPGDLFPLGSSTVHCSAMDGTGHSAAVDIPIEIKDTRPPVFLAPAAPTIAECDDGNGGAHVELTPPTAFDQCDGPIVATRPPQQHFGLGPNPITWTATDRAGQSASLPATVVVEDTEPPEVVSANKQVPLCGDAGKQVSFDAVTACAAQAYDRCWGKQVNVKPLRVTTDESECTPGVASGEGATWPDVGLSGNTVTARVENQNTNGRVYRVRFRATDGTGLAADGGDCLATVNRAQHPLAIAGPPISCAGDCVGYPVSRGCHAGSNDSPRPLAQCPPSGLLKAPAAPRPARALSQMAWVGLLPPGQSVCPKAAPSPVGQWKVKAMGIAPHRGPALLATRLDRYCNYVWEPVTPGTLPAIAALPKVQLSSLVADSFTVRPASGADPVALEQAHHDAHRAFLEDTGLAADPNYQVKGNPTTLVWMIDNLTGVIDGGLPLQQLYRVGAGGAPRAVHGRILSSLVRDGTCDKNGRCAADIAYQIALRYRVVPNATWPDPFVLAEDNGEVGTLFDLAQAIVAAVDLSGNRPAILSLALSYDPNRADPAAHQMVIDAVHYAECSGALMFAAIGNDPGGPSAPGPLAPAMLGRPGAIPGACQATPVHVVSALDGRGAQLQNQVRMTVPELLASGLGNSDRPAGPVRSLGGGDYAFDDRPGAAPLSFEPASGLNAGASLAVAVTVGAAARAAMDVNVGPSQWADAVVTTMKRSFGVPCFLGEPGDHTCIRFTPRPPNQPDPYATLDGAKWPGTQITVDARGLEWPLWMAPADCDKDYVYLINRLQWADPVGALAIAEACPDRQFSETPEPPYILWPNPIQGPCDLCSLGLGGGVLTLLFSAPFDQRENLSIESGTLVLLRGNGARLGYRLNDADKLKPWSWNGQKGALRQDIRFLLPTPLPFDVESVEIEFVVQNRLNRNLITAHLIGLVER